MRDIKFRAWDIDRNTMIGDAVKLQSNIIFHRAMLETAKNVIWMQYTGLKDKNGNPIFDGDICKVDTKHGFNSELLSEFKELKKLDSLNGIGSHFTGIVRIDMFRGLMFENIENGYQEPIFTRNIDIKINHSGIEIIGNIHEHKNILP
jgi:uncharacterized phage protein (TIGR01671 family)